MAHGANIRKIIREEGLKNFISKHLLVYVKGRLSVVVFVAPFFLHNKSEWQELTWRMDGKDHRVRLYSNNFREYASNSCTKGAMDADYCKFNVKGKTVVDIGAFVGDSAIYFALKKAQKIVAFEPYPYTFGIAKKNIAANHMEKKIKLVRLGVSGKSGEIKIDGNYVGTGASTLRNFGSGETTKVITLGELVRKYKIRNAVLKMDCEGSEYGILSNTKNNVLSIFSEIILEYHHNKVGMLSKRLRRAGFSIRWVTKPTHICNRESSNPHFYSGILYAVKN